MINLTVKKDQERYYLDVFRSLFPQFPPGLIEDGESPDFIIHAPNGRVGIELTRIYRKVPTDKFPPQVQESERRVLVEEARRFYESMMLDPVQVHVTFGNQTRLTKRNRKKYAQMLANLVGNNLPSQSSWIDIDNKYESPESFPDEIQSVNILGSPALTRNVWFVPTGGIVQEDCQFDFQTKISEKDTLLPSYRACSAHWLLLIADWSGPSSFYEPSKETLTHIYSASFNRVFFLDPLTRRFSEIPLEMGAG